MILEIGCGSSTAPPVPLFLLLGLLSFLFAVAFLLITVCLELCVCVCVCVCVCPCVFAVAGIPESLVLFGGKIEGKSNYKGLQRAVLCNYWGVAT